jgi:hypothetical protein
MISNSVTVPSVGHCAASYGSIRTSTKPFHGKTEVDTDPDHTRTWNPAHATGQALAYLQLRA